MSRSTSEDLRRLNFRLEPAGTELSLEPAILVVAGYTGRDHDAVLTHIRELAEHGIEPPDEVPSFYALSPELVTQDDRLVTTAEETSGEAEVALLVSGDEVYVTVASDHTDRAAERIDVALSKGTCHKVLARRAWKLSDVANRWDSLRLRSWMDDEEQHPYQDGSTDSLLSPKDVLEAIPWRTRPNCFVLLCGTVPAIGGLRAGTEFRAELSDPHTGATLELSYRVEVRSYLVAPDGAPRQSPPSGAERVNAAARSFGVEVSEDRTAALGARLEALERRLLG